MERIFHNIQQHCQQLNLDYHIVGLKGWIIATTASDEQTLDLNSYLENPECNVFPIRTQDLSLGYVVILNQLTHLERKLFGEQIKQICLLTNNGTAKIGKYNAKIFWKNLLYDTLENDDILYYTDRYNIDTKNSWLLFFVKVVPEAEVDASDAEFIQQTLTDFSHLHQASYLTDIRPGEVVVILEISRNKWDQLEQLKRNFQLGRADILKRLKNRPKLENTKITIGVSDAIEHFESLPKSYEILSHFVRTAAQLRQSSSVLFYERNPMYTLLQHISRSAGQEFVSTVFRNLNDEKHLSTLRVLFKNDLNISKAATELKIHRNTLEYRIHKMKKQTHLDPLKFHDAIQLLLALQLKEVYDM